MDLEKVKLYENLCKKYEIDSSELSEVELISELVEKAYDSGWEDGYENCSSDLKRLD